MAKKPIIFESVRGVSTEDLLNVNDFDIQKMGKKELQKVVGRLVSSANKRIKRLDEKGIYSQAREGVKKNHSEGKFSSKGLTLNKLRSEYKNLQQFFNDKSGSIKGAQQIQKDIDERLMLGRQSYSGLTQEQQSDMWKAYDRLKQLNPDMLAKGRAGTNEIQQEVLKRVNEGKSVDDIINEVQSRVDDMYVSQFADNDEEFDFFGLDEELPFD